MVKLRLKRMGSKFNAFYRIVATDARAPRDGKFIEEIGYYHPHSKVVSVNAELKQKWLDQGAKPSETVKTLFKKFDFALKMEMVKDNKFKLETKPKKPKPSKQKTVQIAEETKPSADHKPEEKLVETKQESPKQPKSQPGEQVEKKQQEAKLEVPEQSKISPSEDQKS